MNDVNLNIGDLIITNDCVAYIENIYRSIFDDEPVIAFILNIKYSYCICDRHSKSFLISEIKKGTYKLIKAKKDDLM